jgi:uncharacterized repeat protein (TIGR01451 family)
MSGRGKYTRLAAILFMVLCLMSSFPLNIKAESKAADQGSFNIYVNRSGTWQWEGKTSFTNYETRRLELNHEAGNLKIRITQQGHDAAYMDYVALEKDGTTYSPSAAVNLETGADVLAKVRYPEYDVCYAWESTLEITWQNVPADTRLVLRAMEEDLGPGHGIPFNYPYIYMGQTLTHTLVNNGGIEVDGHLSETAAPDFQVFWTPVSPHPAGYTYGWLHADSRYLFATVEVTADNTPDAEDWAAFYVKVNGDLKEFRVTPQDTRWGVAGFEYTPAVRWEHRVYEFKIPLSEIGSRVGDEIQYGIGCYGTVTNVQLKISKEADEWIINVGDTAAFTITVTNLGGNGVPGVLVNDPLPAGVDWTTSTPGASINSGGILVDFINNLLPGSVVIQVSGTATTPGTLYNTATVTTPGSPSPPLSATAKITVNAPDIRITKTAALDTDVDNNGVISSGDILKYTNVVNNTGSGDATGVTFSDTPDTNTTLVVGSVITTKGNVTKGNISGDTSVAVNIGTLAAKGGSATITFNVTVNNLSGPTQIANQAVVKGTNIPDTTSDDPSTTPPNDPTVVTAGPGKGTLQILKYKDINANGIRDAKYEPVLPGWEFTITGPNGFNASGITDSTGLVTLSNVNAGNYTITEKNQPPQNPGGGWFNTTGNPRTVGVPAGGTAIVEFGNNYNPNVPASSDTSIYAMIGGLALLTGSLLFWWGRRKQYQR